MTAFRLVKTFSLLVALIIVASGVSRSAALAQSPPNIGVSAKLATDSVKRGRAVQGTVTMEIPSGFHVNSNQPLEKFLIPTQLQIGGPNSVRVGSIVYPRAQLRLLRFSKNRVAVYEGSTTIRFIVTVPASVKKGSVELKGRLRYQSCNDDVCFPPITREFSLWLKVE
jgi:DsbC/DsbD-like thiol-disulfide interchange protein